MKCIKVYIGRICFLLMVLIDTMAFAQGSSNSFDAIFEHLESTRVPSGYLLDKAVEYADIRLYDGTLDADNYSDITVLRNVLATINSSRINSYGASFSADSLVNSLADSTCVNIGAALFKYDYIVSNALTDNLISYTNGQVYDVYVGDTWQNPYAESRTLVFAPSVPAITGYSVAFRIAPSHIHGNLSPSTIQFDAGDGLGYRTVNGIFDQTINYSSSGEKTLRLRVSFADGSAMESHCKFEIVDPPAAPTSVGTTPTDRRVFELSTNHSISAIVSYKSSHSGAVVKPFIFVEGFDIPLFGLISSLSDILDTKRSLSEFFSNGVFDPITERVKGHSSGEFDFAWLYDHPSLPQALKDSYDVFYVDWCNPEADIRDNAALLVEILDYINGLKEENAQRNIVVGHSMGGLVARYALRSMELSGHNHQTDCYVSFDSPHKGVNVPLGAQYALRDLYYALYGSAHSVGLLTYHLADPLVSYFFGVYNSPAARQMMYYYVNENGSLAQSDHNNWQFMLNYRGFPEGDPGYPIENLAVSNGGDYTSPLDSRILDLRISHNNGNNEVPDWQKWLLSILTRMKDLTILCQVDRNYGDGAKIAETTATYRKHWLWIDDTELTSLFPAGYTPVHYSPSGTVGYDAIRSSHLTFDLDTLGSPNSALHLVYKKPVMFVPEASALASDSTHNFYSNPPTPHSETPFDSYSLFNTSKHHADCDSIPLWKWILDQRSLNLSGPEEWIISGGTFSVSGVPSGYNNPSWTVSDSQKASINNNGELTVNNGMCGSITVSYHNSYGDGRHIYKHRRIYVGLPPIVLSAEHTSGDNYLITAECSSSTSGLRPTINQMANSGTLSYVWGYKNGSDSYNWCDTTSVNTFLVTAPAGVNTHVCMKLRTGDGDEGTVSVFDINRANASRYVSDPCEVIVNNYGYTMNYQYISGLNSSKFFAVWCNPDFAGENGAPDYVSVGGAYCYVVSSFTQYIYGDLQTIYCFDIKNTPAFLSAINDVRTQGNNLGIIRTVPIQIFYNGQSDSTLLLPVISNSLPGGFINP